MSEDLSAKSDSEIENWIANHEKYAKTDAPLYKQLLEEKARRSSGHLNVEITLAHLRECASCRAYTTYGKIAELSGVTWSVAYHLISDHLNSGLELCHARDWPLLTALCVNKGEVKTGDLSGESLAGFIKGARRLGYIVTDEKQFLRECQEKCFSWAANVNVSPT